MSKVIDRKIVNVFVSDTVSRKVTLSKNTTGREIMEFFTRHFSILSKKEHALVLVSHDDHGNKYRARKIEDRDKPFALLSMEGGEQFVFRNLAEPLKFTEQQISTMFPQKVRRTKSNLMRNFEHVDKCGYLAMRCPKPQGEVWNRYWFVLKRDRLWYCTSREDQTDIKSISLVGVDRVSPCVHRQYANAKTGTKETVLSDKFFELSTPETLYMFKTMGARFKKELKAWVGLLSKRCQRIEENNQMDLAEMVIADTELSRASHDETLLSRMRTSLEELLRHDKAAEALGKFMKEERNDENLYFVLEALAFRRSVRERSKEPVKLWKWAKTLSDVFLADRASRFAIGVPDGKATRVAEHVTSEYSKRLGRGGASPSKHSFVAPPEDTLFAEVLEAALATIRQGPLPRFRKSRYYNSVVLSVVLGSQVTQKFWWREKQFFTGADST